MIEEIFGYKFKNPEILKEALTHPSLDKDKNYQKLEFLGDRVINLIICKDLIERYEAEKEGDLSKRAISMVRGSAIADIARSLDLGEKIYMSKGEEFGGGRENNSILEDVLEAVIGAIFTDSGDYDVVKKIVLKLWGEMLESGVSPPQDPKSELQEFLQAKKMNLPAYKIVDAKGPAHEPTFTVELKVQKHDPIRVEARSKKEGELKLAKKMLKKLDESN